MVIKFKTKYTKIDFIAAALLFFGVKFLFKILTHGTVMVRGLELNASVSPIAFWGIVGFSCFTLVLIIFCLLFLDFNTGKLSIKYRKN